MISFVKLNMLDAFKDVQIQSFKSNVENSKTNSTTGSAKDWDAVSLSDELIEQFAKSFAKSSKPDEDLKQEAKYIMDQVDKDKNGTVSLDELKNFDGSTVTSETGEKIKDLEDKFKIYDKDLSGELSLAEIEKAIGKNQYSMQELKAMAEETKTENPDNLTLDGQSYSFFKTNSAIDNYKKVDSDFVK